MKEELTKQDILELLDRQAKEFHQYRMESDRLFHQGIEESRKEFDESFKKSRAEFDKRLGELAGTWGKFVTEMVKPRIIELFKEKGIEIRTTLQNVTGLVGNDRFYEIDLLLINKDIAVAVEIKSSLSVEDVKEHLERLEKIQKVSPERINFSGVTLYGAVAGMIVESGADRYAYQNGLFVLRQKGNLVEIANDPKFVPKEWKVEY
ncbi:MAG: hypothetical protein WCP85_28785 [Mariniphaga sp.]